MSVVSVGGLAITGLAVLAGCGGAAQSTMALGARPAGPVAVADAMRCSNVRYVPSGADAYDGAAYSCDYSGGHTTTINVFRSSQARASWLEAATENVTRPGTIVIVSPRVTVDAVNPADATTIAKSLSAHIF